MPSGTHPRSKPYVCLVVSLAHDNCPKAQGILLSCIHVKDIRKNFKVSGGGLKNYYFVHSLFLVDISGFFQDLDYFQPFFRRNLLLNANLQRMRAFILLLRFAI